MNTIHPAIGTLQTAKGIKHYAYIKGKYTEGTVTQLTALISNTNKRNNTMKKKYTFETLGIGKLYTLGVARRVTVKRYGMERTPDKTYQLKVHIGKTSLYFAKKGKKAKQMGGKRDIIAPTGGELVGMKEKVIGYTAVILLIILTTVN